MGIYNYRKININTFSGIIKTPTARSANRGFTIVELMIVIVVIAILAAISIVAYVGIQQRARDAAIIAHVSQWQRLIQVYHAEHGRWPEAPPHENAAPASGQYDGACLSNRLGEDGSLALSCWSSYWYDEVSATPSSEFEDAIGQYGNLPDISDDTYDEFAYSRHSGRGLIYVYDAWGTRWYADDYGEEQEFFHHLRYPITGRDCPIGYEVERPDNVRHCIVRL